MASLSKMSIRGIRSFSPERDETIEFYSPLTMIVGANGCGKTSIIECLKCSATGALPPNSRSGRSFINDPTMTDSTEVKANIKLRFINKLAKATVVVRSFQLTKKKNKMEYKALEGVVRTANDKGDKVSASHKCTDLDKIVPELLGVSAPIMENVLFCHQEENTWPLEDGAILKKKFDEIFESTRYTKALDAILKAKKDVSGRAKDLKAEVAELGAHLLGANEMRDRLESCTDRQAICQRDIDGTLEKIEGVDNKIQRCQDTIRRFMAVQKEVQELQWKLAEAERRVREKTESLEQELVGTDAELDALVRDFDSNMVSKRSELLSMQRTVATLNEELSALRQRNDELQARRGEAKSLRSQVESGQVVLLELIGKLATKYHIAKPSISSTATSNTKSILHISRDFFKQLETAFENIQQNAEQSVDKARHAASARDQECMNCHVVQQRTQMELANKSQEIAKISKEHENLLAEITQFGSRRGSKIPLEEAKRELAAKTKEHDDFMSLFEQRMSTVRAQMKEYNDRIRDLSSFISEDDEILMQLSANRAEHERSAALDKQLLLEDESCREEALSLLRKYRAVIVVTESPNTVEEMQPIIDNVGNTLVELDAEKNRLKAISKVSVAAAHQIAADIGQDEKKRRELQSKLAGLSDEQRRFRRIIVELNVSLKQYDKKELSVDESFDEILEQCKDHEADMYQIYTAYSSSNVWIGKFMKKSTKNIPPGFDAVCPCCERGMDKNVQENYNSSLKKLFKMITKEQETEAEEAHKSVKELIKGLEAVIVKLRPVAGYEQELELIEQRRTTLAANREAQTVTVAEAERELDRIETRLNDTKSCDVELRSVRIRWEETRVRRDEFLARRARQSQSFSAIECGGRSFMDIEQTQRMRKEEKEELMKKKESCLADDSRLTKGSFAVKQGVSDAEKRVAELTARELRVSSLEARVTEIDQLEKVLSEERIRLTQQTSAADRDLKQKQEMSTKAKTELRAAEEKASVSYIAMQSDRDVIQSSIDQLTAQETKAAAANLSDIETRLSQIHQDMAKKEGVIKDYAPRMQSLSAEMSSQEHRKRLVADNISLRQIKVEAEALQTQYNELNIRSGSTDGSLRDSQREHQRAEQDKQKLSTEHAMSVGRLDELKEQQRSLQKQLNSETYKNIDARHRKKNIEYETTMMAVADLESYFQALDGALMNFHTIKIREVNKIVKELWQAIYRGQDIDTIEIISGEEGDNSGVNAKRSYNYRVVMRKGDAPLEMRGRCSAGQCMLAGIVIRLALAESFCLSCGILALDEPTTNLDEPNKAGLAHALARLIASRSNQQNFQLLCITHDEDFVGMMRTELSSLSSFSLPEYYFRVSRQEEGNSGKFFSRIERIPWEDM